jgi:type II secretory pathway pseudopilin PulG
MTQRPGTRSAFTLIDIMITVVLLGILAAVTIPMVHGHIAKAEDVAAQATYNHTRKAVDMYYEKHLSFPAGLTPDLFLNKKKLTLPRGWQMHYWPLTGRLELIELAPDDVEGAPSVVVQEGT